MPDKPRKPVVFISSTEKDLEKHRYQAREAALASGFFPEISSCAKSL